MNAAKLFSAGIPTGPDVDRLVKKFGVPPVGTVVGYSDIVEAIGSPFGSGRFSSVVTAWRKQLFTKHNLVLKAVTNIGYEVLNNSQRVSFSANRYKQSLRGIRRAANVASTTDSHGLSDEETRARDHIIRVGSTIQLAAATAARELRK